MKRFWILLVILLSLSGLQAQTETVRLVLDVTSGEEATQKAALRHLQLMNEAYPDSKFELVIYGQALPMVIADGSPFAEQVAALKGRDQLAIKACEGSMRRFKVTKEDLLPGVSTVPDAIMEIVKKQSEGWAYIKEAN